ncbi:hypothetical protein [Peribacillus frigoritolerans]|uniref:hypothetical protein n=2 Tax=Peribacillus TaxID=2675229 RepID=UPI002281041C|nr:hypothetical protein [Peribacillus frigoritolerans]MCY9137616.1 hypothetical protein [Peribacillus frigoritolerans]
MSISLKYEYDTVEVITMTNITIKDYIGIVIPSCYKTSVLKEECLESRPSPAISPFFKCSLPINNVFSEVDDINCDLLNQPELGSHIKLLLSPFSSNEIKLHSVHGADEFSQRGKAS